jgi:hypothetical protein
MASLKQFKANRQNALKSTGPKTAVGKWIASRNATRHGFYCTAVLLPDEDQEEFLRLARRLALAYSPCGVLEEEQVRTSAFTTGCERSQTAAVRHHRLIGR